MPVRIIFRGLILFRFPKPGEPDEGKLVAELINKPDIPRRPKADTPAEKPHKPPHGPKEHHHDAQIQVATGLGQATDNQGKGDDALIPVGLAHKERLDIRVVGGSRATARDGTFPRAQSFFDHVPRLSDVMRSASIESVRQAAEATLHPNPDLIRNTITVDAGIIRVRNVVMWDHGAFPLTGKRGDPAGTADDRGRRAASHTALKFVGSDWEGHMASEFVVDVSDSNHVELEVDKGKKHPLTRPAKATGKLNHRVPYDTVEILITNYEVQEHTAVPWGLDFQWLFETVGYPAADLAGDFGEFERLGRTFDSDVYDNDRRLLLDPMADDENNLDDYTRGRPFPYVALGAGAETLNALRIGTESPTPKAPRAPLQDTDEEDRPICIGGFK